MWQTADTWSVSRKDAAAAKWQVKLVQAQTPCFHSNSVPALCKVWIECMYGLVKMQITSTKSANAFEIL